MQLTLQGWRKSGSTLPSLSQQCVRLRLLRVPGNAKSKTKCANVKLQQTSNQESATLLGSGGPEFARERAEPPPCLRQLWVINNLKWELWLFSLRNLETRRHVAIMAVYRVLFSLVFAVSKSASRATVSRYLGARLN